MIDTSINGVPASHLKDAMTPNGFIALQVHQSDSKEPLQVRWKNIRIQDNGFNDTPPAKAQKPAQDAK